MKTRRGQILGDYRILDQLGKGGAAEVYEAELWKSSFTRRVALKILPSSSLSDPAAIKKLQHEAKILKKLDHPGIVKLYETGQDGQNVWLALEYIEGPSVHDFLEDLRRNPKNLFMQRGYAEPAARKQYKEYIRKMAKIAVQVGEALEYAHRNNLIHGDVKPSNIMLDKDQKEKARLTDFGIASLVSGREDFGNITNPFRGTPRYMSPEQLGLIPHQKIDLRSDIYSLGATLYEMVALQPPYLENDLAAIKEQMPLGSMLSPSSIQLDLDKDLETIIMKAMSLKPSKRYVSAAKMVKDLQNYLSDEKVKAAQTGFFGVLFGKAQRHFAILLLSSVILLTLTGIGLAVKKYNTILDEVLFSAAVLLSVFTALGYRRKRHVDRSKDRERIAALLLKQGQEFLKSGQPIEAIKKYNAVLQSFPDYSEAAIALMHKAQQARQEQINLLLDKARSDLDQGMYEEAQEKISEAVKTLGASGISVELLLQKAKGQAKLNIFCSLQSVRALIYKYDSAFYFRYSEPVYRGILPLEELLLDPGEYLMVLYRDNFGHSEYWLVLDREQEFSKNISFLRPQAGVLKSMIEIPGGEFSMGSLHDNQFIEQLSFLKVLTPPYYLDLYPVTNKQYREFIKATGYPPPLCADKDHPEELRWVGEEYFPGLEHHPVVGVSWFDALAYCEWAGKRLPTEAEWEHAARGHDDRIYPWGREFDPSKCNTAEAKIGRTTPVGHFPRAKSPFNIDDLVGNVWEWCFDSWHPLGNLPEGKPDSSKWRIIRGGSWISTKEMCSAVVRRYSGPKTRASYIGFRCAHSKF